MDDIKGDKILRVLQIYTKLSDGYVINKSEEARIYGVNERSIQRDIDDIRNFLDSDSERTGVVNSVVYDRVEKGYRLETLYKIRLKNSEVLALCKILLDSRAFTKTQMVEMLDKLVACCVPKSNQKLVQDLIRNEEFHYVEPRHKLKETVSKKSHGKEKRNIDNPRIFPISAATALAIKIGCNDASNKPERETELRDYYDAYNNFCEKLTDYGAEYYVNGVIDVSRVSSNYLLDNYCDVSELQKAELQKNYDHPDQINEYLLLHSGIMSLETAIKSYIEKYAFPIKMRKLLRAFKSILEEVNEENRSYLEDLKDARAGLDDTKKKIDKEKESKDRDSKRKKELDAARKKMENILANVGAIDTDLREMVDIRSRYLKMQEESQNFFEKRPDGSLVQNITNEKAKEIKEKIVSKVKELADQAKDLVEQVKTRRWEKAEEYAAEFNEYLNMLKEKGLLNVGSFNIENTVAYKDIIGNGSFMKYDSYARDIDNPNKEHIEIDDGILNFFASIGRAIGTLFEPSQVNRVDAINYHENLFSSLDGNVTRLINDVEKSYKSDVDRMKKSMSDKMQAVLDLITEIDEEIKARNQKIKNDIETEESYTRKKNVLEADCEFLSTLTYKLKVLKQGGN